MDNFIVSLEVITPLVIYMLSGVALKRSGLIDGRLNNGINGLIVKVFLPFMMFRNIYEADLGGISGGFGLYAGAATAAGFFALFLIYSLAVKDPARVGSMVQGSFRSNAIIFGMPVAESLFGAGNTVEVALTTAICVPIFNVLAVFVLEVCGQRALAAKASSGGNARVDAGEIALGIAKNRLIWGAALGLLVNFLGTGLPGPADTVVEGMSNAVTPLAFISLGASFSLSSAGRNARALAAVAAVKLVLYPMAFMALPLHWGWSPRVIGAMLLVSAAPTAISSYPMAKAMNCDAELAGEIVVMTSAISVFTVFFWIFGLKQAGVL